MQFKFNVIWVNLKFKLEANPNWIMQQFHFEIAVNLTSLTILFWVKFSISFIFCHRKEKSCLIIKTLNYIRMKKSQREEINTNLVLISRFWFWHFEFTSLFADFGHSDWDELNQTIHGSGVSKKRDFLVIHHGDMSLVPQLNPPYWLS